MWNPNMDDIQTERVSRAGKHPAWRATGSIVEAAGKLAIGALRVCAYWVWGTLRGCLNASNSRGTGEE